MKLDLLGLAAASRRFGFALLIALGALGGRSVCAQEAADLPRHDVVVQNAPLEQALRLVAEAFDLNVASGNLPDVKVSLRLKQATADEALGALASASGLRVERRDNVVGLAPPLEPKPNPPPPVPSVRRVVVGPFSGELDEVLTALQRTGLKLERLDNAILLEGLEASVTAAVLILERLRASSQVGPTTEVFSLGVADGTEAQRAVTSLLSEGERAIYDAPEHVLVVTASKEKRAAARDLLLHLERDRPQVEIEARVVEINRQALERIGAEWSVRVGVRGGALSSTWPLKNLDDSSLYIPSANSIGAAGPPFVFSQIDAQDFSLFLELLAADEDTEFLATPRVTTLQNRPANIKITQTLRIPTFTTNAAFATETVSNIEIIEVGTTLEVLPRLGHSGQVYLRITPRVSEVEGFSQFGLPIISERSAATEVVLLDGETLFIGGLLRERERERVQKVPVLGDIPILGRAFQHTSTERDNTELLVFLTPRRLPSPRERASMRYVDGVWISERLADGLALARRQLASTNPSRRVRGLRMLEELDGDLFPTLDLSDQVRTLSAEDEAPAVRTAAIAFILRRRPAQALTHLLELPGGRDFAARALGDHMAPHLRAALGEALGHTPGGVEALEDALDERTNSSPVASARLLRALSAASPKEATSLAECLLGRDDPVSLSAAMDVLGRHGTSDALERLLELAEGDDPELAARAFTTLARGGGGPEGRKLAEGLAGKVPRPVPLREARYILRVQPASAHESAYSWATSASTPILDGSGAQTKVVHAALDLLARKAPDYRHLVDSAFVRVVTAAKRDKADARQRVLYLRDRSYTADRLAHRLVHFAVGVFEARTQALPASGSRALAVAIREEISALERLTGVNCSPKRATQTVRSVLLAKRRN